MIFLYIYIALIVVHFIAFYWIQYKAAGATNSFFKEGINPASADLLQCLLYALIFPIVWIGGIISLIADKGKNKLKERNK